MKEVKETIKAEFAVTEGVSKRHLMDMDMDDVKPALGALPVDWESATDVKGKPDAANKMETAIDVGDVRDLLRLFLLVFDAETDG